MEQLMRSLIAGNSSAAQSWIHTFVHDFLPSFAIAAGSLAAIWLACALIATAGLYLGGFVFLGARALIRTIIRRIRRRSQAEYAHLVTVCPDGVTTTPVNPRWARSRTQQTASDTSPGSGRSTP
jgi:hypothetical protein